jgi:hypothetical protein
MAPATMAGFHLLHAKLRKSYALARKTYRPMDVVEEKKSAIWQ